MIKKFLVWLVYSSENPEKIALTVRGFLGVVSGIILLSTGFLGLHGLTQGSLQEVVDVLTAIISEGLMIVSGFVALFGLLRKLRATFESLQ